MKQEVIDALTALADKRRLTAPAVLKEAKNKKSPLHKACGWDRTDGALAASYRLELARALIQEYEIVITVEERPRQVVRGFISLAPPETKKGRGLYEHRETVMTATEKRQQYLDQLLARIEQVLTANTDLEELEPIAVAVAAVRRVHFSAVVAAE